MSMYEKKEGGMCVIPHSSTRDEKCSRVVGPLSLVYSGTIQYHGLGVIVNIPIAGID
jgi:hypothetical protein